MLADIGWMSVIVNAALVGVGSSIGSYLSNRHVLERLDLLAKQLRKKRR